MCGLTGFLSSTPAQWTSSGFSNLQKMADTIVRRGPDTTGHWSDPKSGIWLAHRRLSIVDLSDAAGQPMVSPSNRFVMVYNGELYNHLELRLELLRYDSIIPNQWRGHSDTETLLAGFDVWGIEETLRRSVGMFAIAVWDKINQKLFLARDRLGEKPLYYGWQGAGVERCFLFGSEMKALHAHVSFERKIDRNSLCLYFKHNYIPAPFSVYAGINKLEPGSILSISLKQNIPSIIRYWSFKDAVDLGCSSPWNESGDEAANELEKLLSKVVRGQLMADVPVGAFLSGGVDSSLIVALVQASIQQKLKTFTIGYDENNYNEAKYAKAVANHLGTDHHELYLSAQQTQNVIPLLPKIFCEPFADASQIPTYIVSRLAKTQVKVALTGDGGDELFAGYNRYILTCKLWSKISKIPKSLKPFIARGIYNISPNAWNKVGTLFRYVIPKMYQQSNLGDKMHKGANVLQANTVDELYFQLVTLWNDQNIVIGRCDQNNFLTGKQFVFTNIDAIERMMAIDTVTYLPDDILCKVDRSSMANSLETRVPFLDHRVVEFAWRIPLSMKLKTAKGKRILRQILYKYVPKNLIERPKMGFGVPIDCWLRGTLRDWAEELLDERRLKREGYLDPVPIRKKWTEHLSGKRNWQYHLWDVLMFQAWLEEWGG